MYLHLYLEKVQFSFLFQRVCIYKLCSNVIYFCGFQFAYEQRTLIYPMLYKNVNEVLITRSVFLFWCWIAKYLPPFFYAELSPTLLSI